MSRMRSTLQGLLGGLMLFVGVAHAGTHHYYYTDPQGTVLAKADAQGNIIASYDYAPYGTQALGTPPSGPGYTGHVNDPDTGLVYMQARYYDPAVGRFISADPVAPASGNLFTFGRYNYASNNPILNIDPNGRQSQNACDIVQCTSIMMDGKRQMVPYGAAGDTLTALTFNTNVGALRPMSREQAAVASDNLSGTFALMAVATWWAPPVSASFGAADEFFAISATALDFNGERLLNVMTAGALSAMKLGSKGVDSAEHLSEFAEKADQAHSGEEMINRNLPDKHNGSSGKRNTDFQGVFRVHGRLDSIRLSKKLDGK